MAKKYLVTLTDDERTHLLALTKRGRVSARKLSRTHILLQADAGMTDDAISQALHIGTATVEWIRKRFVDEGLKAALTERPRPGGQRKLDGKQEAFLIARWPVVPRPRGASVGRCSYSQTSWSNCRWSRQSRMRPCAAR